jgi:hypothetical protein
MGTTTLAIGGSLLYPLAELVKQWRNHGWAALSQHWQERLKQSVLIALTWWTLLFGYHLLYKVPQEIRAEATAISPPRNFIPVPTPPVGWDTPRSGPNLTGSHKTILAQEGLKDRSEWRIIADWQRVRLVAMLSHYPKSKLHIIAPSFEKEVRNYAFQLKHVFLLAGWEVAGPDAAPLDQPAMDIQLSVSEKYWGVVGPPAYTAVKDALQFVSIRERQTEILDPLVPPDELLMWVGAKGPDYNPPDNYPPLQMMMATCQHPLKFTDIPKKLLPDGARFARSVVISPPHLSFRTDDAVLILLTGSATGVYTDEGISAEEMGKVMPRPDMLKITVRKNLGTDSPLNLVLVSDEETQVRCVEDYSSQISKKGF